MLKRKREQTVPQSHKLPKRCTGDTASSGRQLILYSVYPTVQTLRQYLLARLPASSHIRRRRIIAHESDQQKQLSFLDSTLVGIVQVHSPSAQDVRQRDLTAFTQSQRSATGSSLKTQGVTLEETLNFTVWYLFQKDILNSRTPDHLICHGFQRTSFAQANSRDDPEQCLPGILRRKRNASFDAFIQEPWTQVMSLLGRDGPAIMTNLLIDCGVHVRLDSGHENLFQLSGVPIYNLPRLKTEHHTTKDQQTVGMKDRKAALGPASVTFVRSRMMYARPSLNSEGQLHLGLRHIHIFNRCRSFDDEQETSRVMQYIFPRQFGLHNVFTCQTDPRKTTQMFEDYTIREQETERTPRPIKVPRRLRGGVHDLVSKIRRKHQHCSYAQLLRFYCDSQEASMLLAESIPHKSCTPQQSQFITQIGRSDSVPNIKPAMPTSHRSDSTFMSYATPANRVIAFVVAVLRSLLPRDTFGKGIDGIKNWRKFLLGVQRFISMRRFENISLHEVTSGIKLTCIDWLRPLGIVATDKMALSDRQKRTELLHEFLYFVFDSLLIPLLRSNFYITETGLFKNRLFYFRHDIWRRLSEPSLSTLRMSMYQPLNPRQLRHMFETNKLGFSPVRLLPKESGVRPITNLRRKPTKVVSGVRMLGPSINAQLAPTFSVLNLVRQKRPEKLASSMFSVDDIRHRLKVYKARVDVQRSSRFYFIKVDIKSCFDTIPQAKLLDLINNLLTSVEYRIHKHAEVGKTHVQGRTWTKYVSRAHDAGESASFGALSANELAGARKRVVFVATDQERIIRLQQIQKLLKEHLQHNVVRIGRRHYRQTVGIPQGSVLSSLLCNFFYADFEQQQLDFLSPCSLLLRLIDDFLLITTNADEARAFLDALSSGNSAYGISINADKSLANFEASTCGRKIPRLHGTPGFPYCGLEIDIRTLELSRDRQRKDPFVSDALTIDICGRAATTLRRRMLTALQIQLQPMLCDDILNCRARVMMNLFECFVEVAMKLHRYLSGMPRQKRPSPVFLISVCSQLLAVAYQSVHRNTVTPTISRLQTRWIGATALARTLSKKQSQHRALLQWLQVEQVSTSRSMRDMKVTDEVVAKNMATFRDCVY